MSVPTLKKPSEFDRVRKCGTRIPTKSFFLAISKQLPATESFVQKNVAHVGFIVSKKVGNSVTRNRIRRRLKALSSELISLHAQNGYDYVFYARRAAYDRPFTLLKKDLKYALHTSGTFCQ